MSRPAGEPWLLALDLDGTACGSDGHLGERTKRALTAVRAKGHVVCFATGRRDADMNAFWDESRFADYLLLNNGGKLVRTADMAVLANRLIDPEAAKALIGHCLEHGYQLHVLSGGYWGINRWNDSLCGYAAQLGVAPTLYSVLEDTPWRAVEGFMATVDREPICRWLDRAGLPVGCTPSEPGCVDIMAPEISKWNGLEGLARRLGIPGARIIAAGDYDNDLEMIRNAGIGVAVAGALPAVRAAADYVTRSDNDHDAAAEIAERFLLRENDRTEGDTTI